MQKKYSIVIVLALTCVISLLLSWYILDSLLLAASFTFLVLALFINVVNRSKLNGQKYKNIDSAYNFVNLMNIQMISTNSVYEAYKTIENYVSIDFANISNEDFHNQLLDIANEYNINSFKMYINTLIIYDNQGGNYKEMQNIPTALCQKCKIYYDKLFKNKTFKIIEMSTMYLLWLCVSVFIKFAITDFYIQMMENVFYQLTIFTILSIGTIVYYFSFKEYFTNNIRGL